MRARLERAERLLVGLETAYGSGQYEVDDRLRVEEVDQRCDGCFSTAIISVRIDSAFDSAEARRRYHPDRRLIVMTDEPALSNRAFLFEGYPPVQSARWDGRVGREGEWYTFQVEHVFERLSHAREAMVYGRRVRNGFVEDGLREAPEAFGGRSVLMTALPCVFNPDGVANMAPVPLTVSSPAGPPRVVHLFTWEGDSRAKKWTYATALRYLLWFYLWRGGMVFEGNAFSATDELAAGGGGGSSALAAALRREPVSLGCEAMSLVEALSMWSSAAGIHVVAETENDTGRPVTRLRVWSPQDGPLRQVFLARGGRHLDGTLRYDSSAKPVREIIADNNVYRGEVVWDHRDMVNCPVVIGGVKRYEMTLPLCPGWVPRDGLDNVGEGNREAAKLAALTPDQVESLGSEVVACEWYRRFHRCGSEFKYHTDTARLWVLNEDGAFDGELFNRNPPFDDYQPFDFGEVMASTVLSAGGWMRRARPLFPALSTSSTGRSLGVWVEISFDSGDTWQQQSGGIRVLDDRAGVYFDCESPTEITPAGTDPSLQNMWYAIVDQRFRVRVTAVVEGDDRLMATPPPGAVSSPILQMNAMVVRRPESFRYASRSQATNVLIEAGAPGVAERDDSMAIQSLAFRLASENQDRRVRVVPTIPWIETGYAIGDRITEIRGRHLRFATVMGGEMRWPAVTGRRFHLCEGRYETDLTLGITGLSAEAV